MDPRQAQLWLAEAARQSLISEEKCESLALEATSSGLDPGDLAVEKGLMDPVQADIVTSLADAEQAIPGYELIRVLGRGGMGVVYQGRQKNLDRIVAIKTVLLKQLNEAGVVARFEKEATTVARLRHPNIVTGYDFGCHAGRLYFVMEFLEGEDLEAYLQTKGALSELEAWSMARQAASGLAHAIAQGIVHRDIKPANLLLVEPPVGFPLPAGIPLVKITDFGVATLAGEMDESSRITKAGMAVGTPLYMAPEQLKCEAIDHRADIYALGLTVYEMITGLKPYPGLSAYELIARKMEGMLPDIPTFVSPASTTLLSSMLAFDPDQRTGSHEELLQRIDEVTAQVPTAAPTETMVTPRTEARLMETTALPSTVVPKPSPTAPASHSAPTVKTERPAPQKSKKWLLLLAGAAVLLAITGVTVIQGWWPFDSSKEPQKPPARDLVPSKKARYLFDGRSLKGWQIIQGGWLADKDAEKARVLAGNGVIRCPLSHLAAPHYRLLIGADRHQAEQIELHFAFAHALPQGQRRYVLVIDQQKAWLGTADHDAGPVTELAVLQAALRKKASEDEPLYYEMRVERHTAHWWCYIDGKVVGVLPVHQQPTKPELRLVTKGGTAHFEMLEITPLIPPPG